MSPCLGPVWSLGVYAEGRAREGSPHGQLPGFSNALSPSPVPFPSPHRKVPPFPTAQSPPPPLSFLQVVR